jgi:hypothetical protein
MTVRNDQVLRWHFGAGRAVAILLLGRLAQYLITAAD